MSKLPLILLAVLLAGASFLAAAAAHAPPAPEVPPEPVPTRPLYFVANEPAYEQPSDPYYYPQELALSLSDNASQTVSERQYYSYHERNLGPVCAPYACSYGFYGYGALANIGEDFRLERAQDISAVLDYDYSYSENSILPTNEGPIGWITMGLTIGKAHFETEPIVLEDDYGFAEIRNVTFHFAATCDTETHDENGEHPPCDESYDNWTEEIWTHDVTLWIDVSVFDRGGIDFGRYFDMSIGTNGTSLVDLPVFVPPPVVAKDESAIVSIQHEELDADGEVAEPVAIDEETLYYVPGPGLPLLLAGALGAAIVLRRRV